MTFFLSFIGAAAVSLVIYMAAEAFRNRMVHAELYFQELPKELDGTSIFFISDIHRRQISDSIISRARGHADIVIIGGDLAEKGVPLARIRSNAEKLRSIGPAFFVWGNNDYEVNKEELKSIFRQTGIVELNNSSCPFPGKPGIKLLGIEDIAQRQADLDAALKSAAGPGFKVLISHNPAAARNVEEGDGVQLVLSGHTHGGQIHMFGYSPYKKGGIETYPHTTLLVSNGYGTTLLPLRLGAKAETHLVILRTKAAC